MRDEMEWLDAEASVRRLREGNLRFVAGDRADDHGLSRRPEASTRQPVAVVLGCADTRVPPELVFDQGVGDLFVVRAAGNIAGPTQIGSVEFAVKAFGARLIVVLGHTRCAAVSRALEDVRRGAGDPNDGEAITAILDLIRPAIERVVHGVSETGRDVDVREAIRANIGASVDGLNRSAVISPLIESGELAVIGAEYSVETGVVEFLDTSHAL